MQYLFLIIPAILIVSGFISYRSFAKRKSKKRAIALNLVSFCVLIILLVFGAFSVMAASENSPENVTAQNSTAGDNTKTFDMLAAGVAVGLAGIGGGIAVGGTAPAAIGAVSEDPKAFGKSLIFVALGESIALYGLLIAILIMFT